MYNDNNNIISYLNDDLEIEKNPRKYTKFQKIFGSIPDNFQASKSLRFQGLLAAVGIRMLRTLAPKTKKQ